MSTLTATKAGLISCGFCHAVCKLPAREKDQALYCRRCGSRIYPRRRNSLQRTWALLVAAIIFYIPANTLPIMSVVMMGKGQPDTILSGVMLLLESGMWPLAAIVFIASIFVPIMKIIILITLLVSVQRHSRWRPLDRTRLYRITEFVGRWSMVDIFVIAILVALVQFGTLANITPGAGAVSFALVVILTMFAANSFDPRLIWDSLDTDDEIKP